MFDIWEYEKKIHKNNPQKMHTELLFSSLIFRALQPSESISLSMAGEGSHSDEMKLSMSTFIVYILFSLTKDSTQII